MNVIWKTKEAKQLEVQTFAQAHKDLLIIVLNPKDDKLFMAHGGFQILSQVKSATGKNEHLVKNLLKHSRFESNIDKFITILADSLQLPLRKANSFYQWVDGALFNLTRELKKKEMPKKQTSDNKVELETTAIPEFKAPAITETPKTEIPATPDDSAEKEIIESKGKFNLIKKGSVFALESKQGQLLSHYMEEWPARKMLADMTRIL